jgi:hypothetical protein
LTALTKGAETLHDVLLVFSNAVEGREDDNSWYSDQHLAEVLGLEGFTAAQRFVVADDRYEGRPYRYLALYEVEEGRLQVAASSLREATKARVVHISDALDPNTRATWYRPVTSVTTG